MKKKKIEAQNQSPKETDSTERSAQSDFPLLSQEALSIENRYDDHHARNIPLSPPCTNGTTRQQFTNVTAQLPPGAFFFKIPPVADDDSTRRGERKCDRYSRTWIVNQPRAQILTFASRQPNTVYIKSLYRRTRGFIVAERAE